MPKHPIYTALCHPEKKHYAKHLCKACYVKQRGGQIYNSAYISNRRKTDPKFRAKTFLSSNKDCTSTLEEVTLLYKNNINEITKKNAKIGHKSNDSCLDHIHNGPAIGLIPNYINRALREDTNITNLIEYLQKRSQVY